MSKPISKSITREIISAMSSLHMPPNPVSDVSPDTNPFLSDTDANVRHSIEHLHSAVHAIDKKRRFIRRALRRYLDLYDRVPVKAQGVCKIIIVERIVNRIR